MLVLGVQSLRLALASERSLVHRSLCTEPALFPCDEIDTHAALFAYIAFTSHTSDVIMLPGVHSHVCPLLMV